MGLQNRDCLREVLRILAIQRAVGKQRDLAPAPRLRQATVMESAWTSADIARAWCLVGVVPVLAVDEPRHVLLVLPLDGREVLLELPAHLKVLGVVPGRCLQRGHKVRRALPNVVPNAVAHSLRSQLMDVVIPVGRLVALQGSNEVDVARALLRVNLQAPTIVCHRRAVEDGAVLLHGHHFRLALKAGQPDGGSATELRSVTHFGEEHTLVVISVRILWEARDNDDGPQAGLVLPALRLEPFGHGVRPCLVVEGLHPARELSKELASLVQERLLVNATILVVAPNLVEIRSRCHGQILALQERDPNLVVLFSRHSLPRHAIREGDLLLGQNWLVIIGILDVVELGVVQATLPSRRRGSRLRRSGRCRGRGQLLRCRHRPLPSDHRTIGRRRSGDRGGRGCCQICSRRHQGGRRLRHWLWRLDERLSLHEQAPANLQVCRTQNRLALWRPLRGLGQQQLVPRRWPR
mmetsp:Transcript_29197/g.74200  ORF Transcript_29197/g.74200 Transcript_29197/m.74200 type:complete len:465 (-) Transcript_29197:483-1877(-)